MTEWVTIKIPEQTRDEAREDSRTYEQIMKDGLGKPALDRNGDVDADVIAEELKNTISMANEPGVELDTERIINRVDDLETELKREIEGLKR